VQAALAALAGGGGGFDLVLTELTMPGGAGSALIERIQRDWPEMPVVVITGLAAAAAELAPLRDEAIPVLRKPFDPDTLDRAILQALRRR
jgi:DNA-binding NtrC family response regulator